MTLTDALVTMALFLGMDTQVPDVTIEEALRLPTAAVCLHNRDFARDHVAWLKKHQDFQLHFHGEYSTRYAAYCDWIREAEALYDIWDDAWWATADYLSVPYTRLPALRRLRDTLGLADYTAGRMPPPVPTWRFERR